MNVRPVFACAAAGIALLTFGATNATADELSVETLEASPNEVRPGDTITLSGTCDYPDLTVPAPTESGALVPTTLTGEKDTAGVWHLTGTTTVKKNVKPGNWSVLFACAPGDVAVAPFTVLAQTPAPQQPTKEPVAQPAAEPADEQVAVKPKGAAETGDLEEPTDNTALLAVGAAALLTAGGIGVRTYRKRAR